MTTWTKVICGLISVMLFLGACSQKNESPADEASPNEVPETVRVKQTAPEQRKNRSPQAVANRLVQIARNVPNVTDASAIVLGSYTIVGINLDPTLDRGRTGTIKYTVAQALHEDPQGAHAFVTADPDLVQRIRELNEDLKNGRPVQGIMDELAEIAARIVPQPSRETEKKEQKPSRTDQERLK
ncbi:YhcN/YlaJ family sporulation lipoprotein [Thermoactinomyces sp. AMNI-1]|uniref:YhcN/YlaJ family sporulation lipoprotein n=2 Tax=Thermoactinomyces mirandus TaxID=2756294 RepID=A0A7W2AQ70_9BACL|nr:YhcN/YlaJ family sporulation lipoprotein [Thermoactinomyces mirandus]